MAHAFFNVVKFKKGIIKSFIALRGLDKELLSAKDGSAVGNI